MTTTLSDRISQREEWVVASLLNNLDKPWGPNICTALAHTDHWENPVAGDFARAINRAAMNLTKANIASKLGPGKAKWLLHPTFNRNGLPLALAEYEAHELCVYYRGKRLESLIGDAWTKLRSHPEAAKVVAQSLSAALEEYV